MVSPETNTPSNSGKQSIAIAALIVIIAVIVLDLLWNRHIYATTTDLLLLEWLLKVGLCFLLPLVWELSVSKRGLSSLGLIWLDGWRDLGISGLIAAGLLLFAILLLGPKRVFAGGEINLAWMWMFSLSSLFVVVYLFGWCLKRWSEAWGRVPAYILVALFYAYFCGSDGRFRPVLFIVLCLLGGGLAYLVERRQSLLVAWPLPQALAGLLMARISAPDVTTATLWEEVMFARVTIPVALAFVVLLTLIFRGIWPKRLSAVVGALYALVLGASLFGWSREIPLRTAQMAKYVCSGVFVSGRKALDVQRDDMSFIRHQRVFVNRKASYVEATYLGLGKQRAIYRKRLGCTLQQEQDEVKLRKRAKIVQRMRRPRPRSLRPPSKPSSEWILARESIRQLMAPLFVTPKGSKSPPGTKAIVVLYKGHLLAEQYATGYSARMPLLGHSLTKTVSSALTGILIARKKLKLTEQVMTGDSARGDTDRKLMQLHHLLHMTSGLRFSEDYLVPFSHLTVMLYGKANAADYALGLDLAEKPGKRWHYETGTAMLLSSMLRRAFGPRKKAYQRFPHKALFRPLGMKSAVLEQDALGTYLGGSHMYATARDWARFGLLYLNGGRVGKRQILRPSWIKYTLTSTDKAPLGMYGANMWLNGGSRATTPLQRLRERRTLPDWLRLPGRLKKKERLFPKVPPDAYFGIGYGGQLLAMLPSQSLVVVRLSHGMDENWGLKEHQALLVKLLQATQKLVAADKDLSMKRSRSIKSASDAK